MASSAPILITGGAGFIGTHLCLQLRHSGHSVRVLDLKDPERPVSGVDYRRGDVRKMEDLRRATEGVTTVYHLAAIVSVPLCQEHPVESYETNLLGTVRVAEVLSGRPGARVIFAGSSAVYGESPAYGVARQEDEPGLQPISFYAAQKLGSEQVLRVAAREGKLQALSFRFFNVYGPGQDPSSPYSGVISIFTKHVREGKLLKLNGAGSPTRDFVSVHDVARALVSAMSLPASQALGQAVNLGSGQSTSIKNLAEIVIRVSGRSVALEDAPPRAGDIQHSLASIVRARELLGWMPQVNLDEGLRELTRSL